MSRARQARGCNDRMKLLEYEGKALLASHGVPIPAGRLWPQLPEPGA